MPWSPEAIQVSRIIANSLTKRCGSVGWRGSAVGLRHNSRDFLNRVWFGFERRESCGRRGRAPVARGVRDDTGLLTDAAGLKTPRLIRRFIDGLTYQYADTEGSPQRTLRERKGHCPERALVAAALRLQGHPLLLMDLEGERDDDHVLAIYRERGLWGSIAKSNFAGLRSRKPVYRRLPELAMSYFEHYYNLRGEHSLRSYSAAVNPERLDGQQWMTAEEEVWCVPELRIAARHDAVAPEKVVRALPRLDRRSFDAGMHG